MVFTIYGHGGHLGHVTSIMLTNFQFLVPESFIQNLVQNGSVVSEKIRFEFLYVHDLGSRSRNDLDLQYSHTFIKSFSCLYLPTFRSQASIVSEKSTVFTISFRKAYHHHHHHHIRFRAFLTSLPRRRPLHSERF